MTTSRTSVDAIKAKARDAYEDGRSMGMTHDEAIKRAVAFTAMPTGTVEEWCDDYNPITDKAQGLEGTGER